ncbi:hypothetical protein OEZ85_003397 [Tetradesmus obliquus]|uniref:Uncharacterized protein n=1 Tax=Tetradesmus obliquus TaxID=3088 RepID=A0ABY8UBX9_TETOB|nr:hypothetical protein OEZ85_003397 [Tetradesmus obliquus]
MLQQPKCARAVEQQTRACPQQQLLKLELLHIIVDMRKANHNSSAQLVAAMADTDAVLQSGLRALELANRVLTTNGPSWVADRALTAAEIAMAAAVQRLSHMNGMAQQLRAAAAAAQQTRAESGLLNGAAAAAADEADDELRDTCCSILRELGNAAA